MLGAPFHLDHTMRSIYEGGLIGLLSPFALLSGVVSVTMIVMQGAAWLSHKTEGAVADRARWIGPIAALLLVLLFIIAGIWFTVSPWRCRDLIEWKTATDARVRIGCLARLALGLLVAALGATVFRTGS